MSEQVFDYDILILGGGPAGLSAGIYGARGNLKTAIIDISMLGGQPTNYLEIENYPAFANIGGFDLMEKFEEHADKFNVEKWSMEEIKEIDLISTPKKVVTADKVFNAKTVVIATGAKPKKLGIKGETEFAGRGVSYCAVCDGAFFKDKNVTVIGGGNAAVEEAIYLTKFASKVTIVHRRDEFRADKIIQQRALQNPKIEVIWSAIPIEIKGDNKVTSITLKNVKNDEIFEHETDGIFTYIGFAPNVDGIAEQVETNKDGFIEVDSCLKTSIDGVFAAGDVRNTPLRQVITAAADGAIAATYAIKHLELDS